MSQAYKRMPNMSQAYKRMPNMSQAVAGHNSKILSEERQAEQELNCNCIGGLTTCPVEGKCQTTGVVYQASVKEIPTENIKTYTGATARR